MYVYMYICMNETYSHTGVLIGVYPYMPGYMSVKKRYKWPARIPKIPINGLAPCAISISSIPNGKYSAWNFTTPKKDTCVAGFCLLHRYKSIKMRASPWKNSLKNIGNRPSNARIKIIPHPTMVIASAAFPKNLDFSYETPYCTNQTRLNR